METTILLHDWFDPVCFQGKKKIACLVTAKVLFLTHMNLNEAMRRKGLVQANDL
jgi:hypothetical protein